ncbi:MAG TPA: metal-dependent hydrolase [Methanocorpusculum sp.]|nr:metal-dependent hydrolase [Candidatus Methanocorpusculum equi]MCQ2358231.1 metal-dependent hydrolase [Methanocorpusculum sp.]HJJ33445.1 metal-dependent hydrolase [Methanocorpusculum sp.]HJJ44794.1 metal-dependent hydrolase [Methanocorpusculum sp.]
MKLRYAGHSCFIISASKKIVIDQMPPGDNIDADIVLLTHAHGDHLGDHPEKFRRVYAVHELASWLSAKGVDARGMNIGGTVTDGDVEITMVRAEHSSSIMENGVPVYMGEPCGFIIRTEGITIYHAGDTGLFSDMNLIRSLYHPDVALLPAGGLYTMGPAEAMMAAEFVGAPLVIPMHYNTFPAIQQDLTGFKKAIEETTAMKVELLQPGNELTL